LGKVGPGKSTRRVREQRGGGGESKEDKGGQEDGVGKNHRGTKISEATTKKECSNK